MLQTHQSIERCHTVVEAKPVDTLELDFLLPVDGHKLATVQLESRRRLAPPRLLVCGRLYARLLLCNAIYAICRLPTWAVVGCSTHCIATTRSSASLLPCVSSAMAGQTNTMHG